MFDPHLEVVRFAVFALAIGIVVFGGTTLAYFLDKQHRDPSSAGSAARGSARALAPLVSSGDPQAVRHTVDVTRT
jgi:hypothetical protein